MTGRDVHCSYCGTRFGADISWPGTCDRCGNISYKNPLPVTVMLVPVDRGLVFIRRGIEPEKGKPALPGGYVNTGETWRNAGAREVFEETGIRIRPDRIGVFDVRSAPDDTLLIFGLAERLHSRDLPPFAVTDETTERMILDHAPPDMAFALHDDAAETYFRRKKAAGRPAVGVAVILIRDGKVLLGRRRNSHGAGTWQFPGGHLEYGEAIEDCARREVFEETGLRIRNLRRGPFTNDLFTGEEKHYITIFLIAEPEPGEPVLREPDKCAEWAWFSWDHLPAPAFLPIRNLLKQHFSPFT